MDVLVVRMVASSGTTLRNRDCGAPVHARVVCEAGHNVPVTDVQVHAGPGAIPASDERVRP